MVQPEIAVLRFGLGARPGDLTAAAGDPRGWLTAQIKGAVLLAGNTPLAPSDQIFSELLAARAERQEMKRAAVGQSTEYPKAMAMPVFNPVRDAYLPHYRAQVLARARVRLSRRGPLLSAWFISGPIILRCQQTRARFSASPARWRTRRSDRTSMADSSTC
jgi:uncharacterized protein (DUF1800 family)